MTRKAITNRFFACIEAAEKYNSKPGNVKRFYPMTDNRRGHMTQIGMYDYTEKRYVLCDILSWQVDDAISEIESMVGL